MFSTFIFLEESYSFRDKHQEPYQAPRKATEDRVYHPGKLFFQVTWLSHLVSQAHPVQGGAPTNF